MKFGQQPRQTQSRPSQPRPPQRQQEPVKESYEDRQPRPYSWKTDEFQLKDTSARPTTSISQAQQMMRQQQAAGAIQNQRDNRQMTRGYRCPRCSTPNLPHSTRKISSAGWIVFAILLVFFFPLFWIGLLMKEDVLVCPVCNLNLT